MADRYNDYEARLEAKRKDDEKRWREIAEQIRQPSDLSGKYPMSPELQAMLMSGYARPIGGGGGGGGGMSWLDKGVTPRPMLTPEQREAQSRAYAAVGTETPRGRGSAVEDERKRLEAMMAIYKGKDVLSAEEQAHVAALREAWNKLSGIKTPETLPEEEDEGFWSGIGKSFKSWFGGEKKSPGLQGLE